MDAPLLRMALSEGGGLLPASESALDAVEDRRGGLALPFEVASSSQWAVVVSTAAVASLTARASSNVFSIGSSTLKALSLVCSVPPASLSPSSHA